jgi:hypothetical protein
MDLTFVTPTQTTRRKKLSAHIRRIEHNVFMHLKREVRHTGRGWMPLYLDPAWDNALKRLVADNLVVEHPELCGYVPAEFAAKMLIENNEVLLVLQKKSGPKCSPVRMEQLPRNLGAALGRLVIAGLVGFEANLGYWPLRARLTGLDHLQ